MFSFGFPRMFNNTQANLVEDKDAIRSNMILLLSSEQSTLFGDPYYGSQLKKYIFEQRNSIIVDLLIDELYTTIATFMPQVYLTRKDITIYSVDEAPDWGGNHDYKKYAKTALFAEIKYHYTIDNTSDLFTIKLTEATEEV